jgi:hypothetical protein
MAFCLRRGEGSSLLLREETGEERIFGGDSFKTCEFIFHQRGVHR